MCRSIAITISVFVLAVCTAALTAEDAAQDPSKQQPGTESQSAGQTPTTPQREAKKADTQSTPAKKTGTEEKPSGPVIDALKPQSGDAGDLVTITGKGFGKTAGTVKFNGKAAKVDTDTWTDTKVTAVVPQGAKSGDVTVLAGGNESGGKPFTINVSYDKTAFEVVTGVGAEVAGEEVTSYKVDTTNNALTQTNVGRKTVEILLGGQFILPWRKGGGWIEKSYCGRPTAEDAIAQKAPCREGGDAAYKNYRPWVTFLSIRFAPTSDQSINGFVVGGGYRITKYFTLLTGYAVTPFTEPTHGFRVAASQVVAANPTIAPYNHFNADDLLNNRPGAFDGFPLFLYNANGVTTTKVFPTSPTVVHYHSGIYFGVGIPLNLTALFKPSGGQ